MKTFRSIRQDVSLGLDRERIDAGKEDNCDSCAF
jgi:hypothetical protein